MSGCPRPDADPVLQHGAKPARMPAAVPAVPGEEGAAPAWEQPLDVAVEGISDTAPAEPWDRGAAGPQSPAPAAKRHGVNRGARCPGIGLLASVAGQQGQPHQQPVGRFIWFSCSSQPGWLTAGCGRERRQHYPQPSCLLGKGRQRWVKGHHTFIRAPSPDRFVLFQLPKAKLIFQVLPAQSRSERGAAARCRPACAVPRVTVLGTAGASSQGRS